MNEASRSNSERSSGDMNVMVTLALFLDSDAQRKNLEPLWSVVGVADIVDATIVAASQ